MNKETVWIIVGTWGMYYGTYPTRKQAIEHHTKALGKSWQHCRNKFDKAVKAEVTWNL